LTQLQATPTLRLVEEEPPITESTFACTNGRGDDRKQRQPTIDRAKKILKWEPNLELEERLQKTSPFFQKRPVRDGR
jgi:nucleoside-diphosphate-sugar epimerase